jgi:hypothetical protein
VEPIHYQANFNTQKEVFGEQKSFINT